MKTVFTGRYEKSEILNGPEKVAKRIFDNYSKTEKCIFVEYFFDGRKYSMFKKLFGNEKTVCSNNSKVLRLGILSFLIFLIKEKPVNIHLITFERFALIVFLHKLIFRVRVIYNVHGIIAYEDKIHDHAGFFLKAKNKFCENIFIRYSDVLIFLSKKSLLNAKKFYRINEHNVVFIPNGIDKIFYENSRSKEINHTGNLKIVFYGNPERKEKGLSFLLQCLEELEFVTVLYVISDNIDLKTDGYGKATIHSVKKMDAVTLSEFYNDKDVFVSASYYEQFSIASAEAIAAGLTAVVTEESGISEYITQGTNGFTFKYGDKKTFNNIITELNDNRQILSEIFRNSETIYEKLSWDSVIKFYSGLYK